MRRRPVCLLCLVMVLLCSVLFALGIPLNREYPGEREAARIVSEPGQYRVCGYVGSFETRESDSVCVLTDAFLSYQSKLYSIGIIRITTDVRPRRSVGTLLEVRGELRRIAGAENPGQFDGALYSMAQGIRFEMRAPEVTALLPQNADSGASVPAGFAPLPADFSFIPRRSLLRKAADAASERLQLLRETANRRILAAFPKEVSGILCSVLTGSRAFLEDDSRSLWRTGGILHMLAISGLHLSLLGAGLFELLRRAGLGLRASGVISSCFLIFYTVFTGLSVSTVRACVMFSLRIGARLLGRTYDPPTALGLAAILLLLENPCYLLYSGFQLSFAAVLICILFQNRGKMTTASMLYLGMLPLVLQINFEAPLYGILVNLIAIPMLPFLLGFGLAGALLGGVSAYPAALLIRGLNLLLAGTAELPHASLILGRPGAARIILFYAALAGWALLVKRNRLRGRRFLLYLLTPLLVAVLAYRPRRGMLKMTFLSVGQGDGIVAEFPTGENILVDAGSSSVGSVGRYRVEPFLKSEGISRLDYVFATHMDDDHISGIRELLDDIVRRRTSIRVGTLAMPYLRERDEAYESLLRLAEEAGARVLLVSAGDSISIGNAALSVIGPDPALEMGLPDANAQCIVMGLHFGAFDALLTGDAEGAGEENLIRHLRAEGGGYEVLKVAHHGSRGATQAELLQIVRPQVSVISCGRRNRYGHPHDELMERLKGSGSLIFRTDLSGAITVRVTRGGARMMISTYLAPREDAAQSAPRQPPGWIAPRQLPRGSHSLTAAQIALTNCYADRTCQPPHRVSWEKLAEGRLFAKSANRRAAPAGKSWRKVDCLRNPPTTAQDRLGEVGGRKKVCETRQPPRRTSRDESIQDKKQIQRNKEERKHAIL